MLDVALGDFLRVSVDGPSRGLEDNNGAVMDCSSSLEVRLRISDGLDVARVDGPVDRLFLVCEPRVGGFPPVFTDCDGDLRFSPPFCEDVVIV